MNVNIDEHLHLAINPKPIFHILLCSALLNVLPLYFNKNTNGDSIMSEKMDRYLDFIGFYNDDFFIL